MAPEIEAEVDASGSEDIEEEMPDNWLRSLHLPCGIEVELPIHDYRVGDAVQLAAGRILDTQWKVGRDLPLFVNRQLVAWVEFEVLGGKLAARVTELADDPGESQSVTPAVGKELQING